MNTRLPGLAAAGALAMVVALAGCGGRSGTSDGSSRDVTAGSADRGTSEVAPPAGGAATDQLAVPAQYRREDRSIIYTGDITVRVTHVDRAAADAVRLVQAAGGFVGADKRTAGSTSADAHLTLRVPADRFSSTVDALAALGTEESRGFSAEDVTAQVVDLDAQIASQQASVDRTRALLARAQTVAEIVSIEGELAKREGALATLQARKNKLADLSALSTITAHLLGPNAAAKPADKGPSFLGGLRAGWRGLLGALTVVLVSLGFLLPFAAVLAVPVAAWWLLRRRRRLSVPPPVPPAADPVGGAGPAAP